MKRLAAVVSVAAFAAGVAVAALGQSAGLHRPLVLREAASTSPLLGLRYGRRQPWLVRLDPATLKARAGRRLGLAEFSGGWTYSPDRTQLAFGNRGGNVLAWPPARVRLVDARTLRTVRKVPLGIRGEVPYLHWTAPDRLLVLLRNGEDPGDGGPPLLTNSVVVLDPVTGAVRASGEVEGSVTALATADHALVLVLAGKGYGPVRLAVGDDNGKLASVTLDRIEAGVRGLSGDVLREERPAVAVDRAGGRAYVVAPAGNLVAEVDLATLAVDYHAPAQPASLFGRLHDWLEPPARAKGPLEGNWRSAVWLGDGRLAVFGRDASTYSTDDGLQVRQGPSGLVVIDTRSWASHVVDPRSSSLVIANDALFSWGWGWDSGTRRETGAGLNVYDKSGLRRLHLFGARVVYDVQVVGRRAFVRTRNLYGRYASVDIRTGRQIRTIGGDELPIVLSSAAAPFYG